MPFLKPGFTQILSDCSVSWKITPLYFCCRNLVYIGQKEPIENKFSDFWVAGWKFTKFLMSYLKPEVSFSLSFASLSSVMRYNYFVLFQLKLYMIWTKGTHQSTKFQTFNCSCKISASFYFDKLLLLNVYQISAEKA